FLAGYGPEAADATRDARDQNCDDADGDDGDGDGYVDARSGGDDCDDDDASAWPGAPELCDDAGADEDCDGTPDDGCFEGADCQDILMNDPAATSRAYHLDPDGPGGAAPFDAWCDMTTDGGGWTKVAYFTGSRATTTGAVTASTLATSLAGTGKLSDAQINTLMGNHHEMLAAQAANPARWVRVTWGDTWTWDESRVSGALGDHCQDLPYGGWLQRWDGTTTFASYRMSTPGLRSSYCWRFSWNEGGEGGIDLQDDGDGASNASTTGVAQSPFVMFVRRGDPTCDVHADCPVGAPICDAGVCAPAQDCEELHDLRPGLATGTYGVDPLGSGAPTPAWCDMTTDGGGWTKILYFSSTRALTTGAVAAQGLSGSLIEEGKLSDAMINALMGADHKMLAVYPANPARWLVATWGTAWTFKDDRPSGQAGGFCQTVAGGGGLRLWDGSSRTANYTDAANLRSSYCYNTDTGFDLQNDGTGQSNAALPGVSQQPFVMFVRR
ncbi:MAG TPA: fibrinogen-like YCDxxxxGGGW domain-containing protein, partial [Myxococcota bacterium]|nr:fibrinogen-like YCDxxxxGGGW domain-containing protein [Myxococcota bacterium]